jgi:hypothetical protein
MSSDRIKSLIISRFRPHSDHPGAITMKRAAVSALVFGVALLVVGYADGASLKGHVIENELGGPPLGKAKIGAEGANPTESDDLGLCTLDFPNKRPGEPIKLIVVSLVEPQNEWTLII